jgi:acyl carrier protein
MRGSDTMTVWSAEFEAVLREHLPELPAREPLETDTPLGDLGLDSLGVVGLVVDLEAAFEIALPEGIVTPETFYTADTLWSAVETVRTRH